MTMLGNGCFVAWYDVKPGEEAAHDHWHAHEHMIERVAIPGFLRGQRYHALAAGPRVCIIYQVDALATLTSPAYLERLNNPTPWTNRIMASFAGMNRTLARVVASFGHGLGGSLLTIRLAPRPGEAAALEGWLTSKALPELARRSGASGAHLLMADRGASALKTEEKRLRGTADEIADWIVLVEGHDRAAIEHAGAELAGADGLVAHGAAAGFTAGLYGLVFTLDEREAKALWRKPAA